MAEYSNQRQLRNLILNQRFQFAYVGLVIFVSAAMAMVLGSLIWQQSNFASQQIIANIESHWNDSPPPDFVVVTGHSEQMRGIVKEVRNEYDLNIEEGLHPSYMRLTF